jgi:SEC-C motif
VVGKGDSVGVAAQISEHLLRASKGFFGVNDRARSRIPFRVRAKSRSSRNALSFGLFTLNDFVRENEAEDYTKICTSLWTELTPEGAVEEFLTTELMSATWRLRRCRMVEEDLAEITILDPMQKDPMQNPETEKQQKSVDRAQSHSIFHRCLAALRKVQTERGIRNQFFPESGPPEGLGLMDMLKVSKVKPFDPGPASPDPAPTGPDAPDAGMDALMALAEQQIAQRFREQGLAGLTSVIPTPTPAADPQAPPEMASNCKPAATVPATAPNFPRNAPCHCGSGAKYKRCLRKGRRSGPRPRRLGVKIPVFGGRKFAALQPERLKCVLRSACGAGSRPAEY